MGNPGWAIRYLPPACTIAKQSHIAMQGKKKDFFINCIAFLLPQCLWWPWPEFHSALYVQNILCLCRHVVLGCCWPGPTYRPLSLLLMLCKYLDWTHPSSQSLIQDACGSYSSVPKTVFVFLAHLSLPRTERCKELILVSQQTTVSLRLDIIKNIYRASWNLLMCCYIASVLSQFLYQLIKLLLYCTYIMQHIKSCVICT